MSHPTSEGVTFLAPIGDYVCLEASVKGKITPFCAALTGRWATLPQDGIVVFDKALLPKSNVVILAASVGLFDFVLPNTFDNFHWSEVVLDGLGPEQVHLVDCSNTPMTISVELHGLENTSGELSLALYGPYGTNQKPPRKWNRKDRRWRVSSLRPVLKFRKIVPGEYSFHWISTDAMSGAIQKFTANESMHQSLFVPRVEHRVSTWVDASDILAWLERDTIEISIDGIIQEIDKKGEIKWRTWGPNTKFQSIRIVTPPGTFLDREILVNTDSISGRHQISAVDLRFIDVLFPSGPSRGGGFHQLVFGTDTGTMAVRLVQNGWKIISVSKEPRLATWYELTKAGAQVRGVLLIDSETKSPITLRREGSWHSVASTKINGPKILAAEIGSRKIHLCVVPRFGSTSVWLPQALEEQLVVKNHSVSLDRQAKRIVIH